MRLAVIISLPLWWLPLASAAPSPQNGKSIAPSGTRDLGAQIKAAVMIGLINAEDASGLAKAIMAIEASDQGSEPRKQGGKGDGQGKDRSPASGKSTTAPIWQRFALPGGGSLDTLLEPEFLPRDAAVLVPAWSLDPAASAIIETLLADHADRFERARQAVLDAVASARRAGSGIDLETAATLEAVVGADLDRHTVMANLRGLGVGKDGAAVAPEDMAKWVDWALTEAAGLQQRVAAIQTFQRKAASDESPEQAAIAALGRVTAFRSDRPRWRRTLEDDLAAIAAPTPQETLELTFARLRVEHGRRRGRFAGDAVDLDAAWTAAIDTTGIDETSVGRGREALDTRLPDLAAAVDARTTARIATECAALRWYLDGLAGDQPGIDREARIVEDAADVQVTAELAVRDLTLSIGETMAEAAEETSPAFAAAFRSEMRRRAFPEQHRRLWCETAMTAALGFDDLTDEQRSTLATTATHLETQLDRIRDLAIEERRRREVRIARAMAEAIIDDYASAKSLDEETWEEPERDAFERLDAEVGTALRQLLTPDQLERLPGHPSIGTQLDPKQDPKPDPKRASGKNAGTGSKGSSGKGRK